MFNAGIFNSLGFNAGFNAGVKKALNVSVTESVTATENFVPVGISYVSVTQSVTTTEAITVSNPIVYCSAIQTVSVEESLSLHLNELNVSLVEQGISVTEHGDVLDLIIEVGVIVEYLNAFESVGMFMPWLIVMERESIVDVVESVSVVVDVLFSNVQDDVAISEVGIASVRPLFLSVYDELAVQDVGDILMPILNVIETQIVLVWQNFGVGVTPLLVDVTETMQITINDVAQVLDLVIELGWCVEYTNVYTFIDVSVNELFFNVYDEASVVDYDRVVMPVYFASIFDDVQSLDEITVLVDALFVNAHDHVQSNDDAFVEVDNLFLEVAQNLSILDSVGVFVDALFVSAVQAVTVVDLGGILLNALTVDCQDDVVISDVSGVLIDALFTNEFDAVTVIEAVMVNDIIIELFASDSVHVHDAFGSAPDELFTEVYDSLVLSEYASLTDIWIDIWLIFELIGINEEPTILLPYLTANVESTAVLSETCTVIMPLLMVDVADLASAVDFVVEIEGDTLKVLVFDNVSADDISIMPFGMSVGDDVGVTGALVDRAWVTEAVYVSVAILNVNVSEFTLSVVEYINMVDIVVEIPLQFEFTNVMDDAFVMVVLGIIVSDNVSVVEAYVVGFPLTVFVFDSVAIVESFLTFTLNMDLYPRIFKVVPRERIFLRDKVTYEEVFI